MKPFFKPIPWVLFLFSIYITLVCASLLNYDSNGNLIAHSYSIWGDWSAHFTFINAIKERGFSLLWGDNPLFPGIPFQYPFLSHVLTYFFSVITPFDVIQATYLSSLILIFFLPIVLYRFFRALKLLPLTSLLTTFTFLLIGGTQWLSKDLNPKEPLTNQFTEGSIFTQFILFEFFPQRAFLFGLISFALLATYALQQKSWTLKKIIGLGFFISCLALMHVHTWLAMATLLLFLLLFPAQSLLPRLTRQKTLYFGMGVALLSILFLSFLLLRGDTHQAHSTWEYWLPGWAQNPKNSIAKAQEMSFVSFWFFNTGIFLPFSLLGFYFSRANKALYSLFFSGILLFIISTLINIQPYYYDNLKLYTYSFLFLAPFVGIAFEQILKFPRIPKWLATLFAIFIFGAQTTSAILDLESFRNGLQTAPFFSKDEFDLAIDFKALRSSSNAIVLINPRHNHWVPCLTGNPVAMGYGGWLWTWGINASQREQQVAEVLTAGPHANEILSSLHIAYIVVHDQERILNRPVNHEFLSSRFKKVLSRSGWSVYSVAETLISPSSSVR